MTQSYCRICGKTIDADKESSILCDICNSWIHPKCNHLNILDFQHISGKNNDTWFCCKKFPFGNLNNPNFHSFIHSNSEMNELSVAKYSNDNSILKLRQDVCIYKSSELESTFIELINPKKANIIIV